MERSKAERAADAKQKIKAIADWFTDRKLPDKPFKLNQCTTVDNCKNYVSTQLVRMQSMDIYDRTLQSAYLKLVELKTFLEK